MKLFLFTLYASVILLFLIVPPTPRTSVIDGCTFVHGPFTLLHHPACDNLKHRAP